MKHKPVIFFDSRCSFCKRAVICLIVCDKKKKLQFTPLSGKTADRYLQNEFAYLKTCNTLVLIEHTSSGHIVAKKRASAVLRILWILGGFYRLSAVFYPFLFLLNPLYRLFARYRKWFFAGKVKSLYQYWCCPLKNRTT